MVAGAAGVEGVVRGASEEKPFSLGTPEGKTMVDDDRIRFCSSTCSREIHFVDRMEWGANG